MFIRSQDKKRLINVTQLGISNNTIYGASAPCHQDIAMVLGHYETEERVIGVLDEIENTLRTNASYDEMVGKVRIKKEVVFEMPRE